MSNLDYNTVKSMIEEIRTTVLPYQNIENAKLGYYNTHMKLAEYYYHIKDFTKTFYHLTECHGITIRQYGIIEGIRREMGSANESIKWEYLSSSSNDAADEDVGLFRRFSQMPSEWTVVQLTQMFGLFENQEAKEGMVNLREMFISRLQCGQNHNGLLVSYITCPDSCRNLIKEYTKASKDLLTVGNSKVSIKTRRNASMSIQRGVNGLDNTLFSDYKCLFLGKLIDTSLQSKVRNQISSVFKKYNFTCEDEEFFYLMAEGVEFYEPILIKSSIEKNLPDDKRFKKELYNTYISLLDLYPELKGARRYPVILIVDEYLDIIPWEMCDVLRNQSVTRVPSVHFLYAMYRAHEPNIHNGYKEIKENKVNYYVLNPDGDLCKSQEKLKPFFDKRLTNWKGFFNSKPSASQLAEALTQSNTYMYCGHGGGFHLVSSNVIKTLDLKNSVQILFGCSSAALKHLGGPVSPMGHILYYTIAGSACSVGMLYTVISDAVDAMTIQLANLWLPGTPLDPKDLKPLVDSTKEPDLLKAIAMIKESNHTMLYSNYAGFIVRGLPVKLVHQ